MTANKDVVTPKPGAVQQQREQDPALRPPVDISETSEGITLRADIPGVNRDRLDIRVDKDTLFIEGDLAVDMPEAGEVIHADLRYAQYRRSFALSGELQTDSIEARLQDGVLTVRIPKRVEVRPRKIEVRTE
jgi:HSP20 family molecular chaperone IbpA